jgi:hypothetical protein
VHAEIQEGGMKFFSATEVLQPFAKFDQVTAGRLIAAQELGKEVHTLCFKFCQRRWPVRAHGKKAGGYFFSFKDWYKQFVYDVIEIEPELKNEAFGFLGHPDLILRLDMKMNLPRREIVTLDRAEKTLIAIIDLKTPITKSKAWALQMAAYHALYPAAQVVGTLQLDPEGKTATCIWYQGSRNADFNVFLTCLQAYRYFNE